MAASTTKESRSSGKRRKVDQDGDTTMSEATSPSTTAVSSEDAKKRKMEMKATWEALGTLVTQRTPLSDDWWMLLLQLQQQLRQLYDWKKQQQHWKHDRKTNSDIQKEEETAWNECYLQLQHYQQIIQRYRPNGTTTTGTGSSGGSSSSSLSSPETIMPHLIQLIRQEDRSNAAADGDDSSNRNTTMEEWVHRFLQLPLVKQQQTTKASAATTPLDALERYIEHKHDIQDKVRKAKEQQAALQLTIQQERQLLLQDLPQALGDLQEQLSPSSSSSSSNKKSKTTKNGTLTRTASAVWSSLLSHKQRQPRGTKKAASSTTTHSSTARLERIKQAMELPPPLYTLYAQLQSYLDRKQNTAPSKPNGEDDDGVELSLTVVDAVVQLVLHVTPTSIGAAATGGNQTRSDKNQMIHVPIAFDYHKDCHLISASMTSTTTCSSPFRGNNDWIGELFPGDTGAWTGPETNTELSTTSTPRCFQWCNYMAGLHIVSQTHPSLTATVSDVWVPPSKRDRHHLSTQAIVEALIRRVRAHSRVSHLLQVELPKLFRHWQEQEPQLEDHNQHTNDEENDTGLERIFQGTLPASTTSSTQKESSLMATVHVHMGRYPAVPPRWILVRQEESSAVDWGSNSTPTSGSGVGSLESAPLYNSTFTHLQDQINLDCLKQEEQEQDDAFYEDVLLRQGQVLVKKWNVIVSSSGAGS